ncbi:MAG: tol-pal system protein YbgF [Gammaproteobacteria bacterium]|nr:MAG: tol-pal system protein YbgF [Gammaproteobacteria bacterium]RLA59198.1 MAG: tol-pal system protein YbgF [Gammaproteobacteria bacterium]
MQSINKAFVVCGLVILTGPLCIMARAQDYVDVEAERAAAAASGISSTPEQPQADPYGAQPARAYPATSYGLSRAPAGSAVAAPVAAAPVGGQASGQNLANLFYQIQQLQQEVMQLNGKVEEQAHELRNLKEQSLQRYVDLDKRLSGAGGSAASVSAGASSAGGSSTVVTAPVATGGQPQVAEQPGEGDAYRAAYALVRDQKFDQAVQRFEQFLQDYPGGKYAPNAHYWLGELYLVIQPPNLESSRQSFTLLLSQYPHNNKAPDALYKLGKVQFMKGNRERAREYLDRVISEYGSTNSSAVKLARDFIAQNY